MSRFAACTVACLLLLIAAGCGRTEREVVIYVAHDRVLSEPILREFGARTGIRVRPLYDVEANKTVGLANRLIAESPAPRADVFWNNEVIQTVRLQSRGVVATEPLSAATLAAPPIADASRRWVGFAARARVLLLNLDAAGEARNTPLGLQDLARRQWHGRVAVANPRFGTTGTHFAALLTAWGEPEFRRWLRSLRDNGIAVLPGNAQVRDAVASGEMILGLTDTDDAVAALAERKPVAIVFPDQQGPLGTLLIPNSVALVTRAPHPDVARELSEYLLSSEVEAALARGRGAQLPINHDVQAPENLPALRDIRTMSVDFSAVAAHYEKMLSIVGDEWPPESAPTGE
jgi:iron(III) transport system substrate-binding protein